MATRTVTYRCVVKARLNHDDAFGVDIFRLLLSDGRT